MAVPGHDHLHWRYVAELQRPGRQAKCFAGYQYRRSVRQFLHLQTLVPRRFDHKRQIDLLGQQPVCQCATERLRNTQVDRRMLFDKFAKERRQDPAYQRWNHTGADGSGNFLGYSGHFKFGHAKRAEDGNRMTIETLSRSSRDYPSYRPLKKIASNELLNIPYLRAQSRLGTSLTLGRFGKASLLEHRGKILQMTKADTRDHGTGLLSQLRVLANGPRQGRASRLAVHVPSLAIRPRWAISRTGGRHRNRR